MDDYEPFIPYLAEQIGADPRLFRPGDSLIHEAIALGDIAHWTTRSLIAYRRVIKEQHTAHGIERLEDVTASEVHLQRATSIAEVMVLMQDHYSAQGFVIVYSDWDNGFLGLSKNNIRCDANLSLYGSPLNIGLNFTFDARTGRKKIA